MKKLEKEVKIIKDAAKRLTGIKIRHCVTSINK